MNPITIKTGKRRTQNLIVETTRENAGILHTDIHSIVARLIKSADFSTSHRVSSHFYNTTIQRKNFLWIIDSFMLNNGILIEIYCVRKNPQGEHEHTASWKFSLWDDSTLVKKSYYPESSIRIFSSDFRKTDIDQEAFTGANTLN